MLPPRAVSPFATATIKQMEEKWKGESQQELFWEEKKEREERKKKEVGREKV